MKNLGKIFKIFLMISCLLEVEAWAGDKNLLVVQPKHVGRTPKVSFVVPAEQTKLFGGLVSEHAQEKQEWKDDRRLRELAEQEEIAEPKEKFFFTEKILDQEKMDAFQTMTKDQLKKELAKIIPLPQILEISDRALFDKIQQDRTDILQNIFNDTMMMVGDVSIDVFNRFFDVRCSDAEVAQQYQTWLYAKLIPAITELLQNRLKEVKKRIVTKQAKEITELEMWQEIYQGDVAIAQNEINEARRKQIASLAIVPMAVMSKIAYFDDAKIFEYRAVRWISLAAFTGLTISMLQRYSDLIQRANTKRARAQGRVAESEHKKRMMQALSIPQEVAVIDQVTGKLIRELHAKIGDFSKQEEQRLIAEAEALKMLEASRLQPVATQSVPVAALAESATSTYLNLATERLTEGFQNVVDGIKNYFGASASPKLSQEPRSYF